jgi:nitrogen regulatory protein PII
MKKVTIEELIEEAKSKSGIGKAWIKVVETAVRSKVRGKPPKVFGFQEWDEATIQDVVQEVFEGRILKKGGKEYILAEATTTDHAYAGIYRLVSLALSDMREPNVLNNIYDNLARRISEVGIDLHKSAQAEASSDIIPNEEAAEILVREILLSQPRYPNRGSHRESAIFAPESYENIVKRLKSEVFPLTASVIRGGLKRALTHLVRAEYYIDDAHDFHDRAVEGLSVENEAISEVQQLAVKTLQQLSQQSEKVFVAQTYGVASDVELARALGLKARQTAKKWHDTMKLELFNAFENLGVSLEDQIDVVLAMRDQLGISQTNSIKESNN